MKRLMYGGLLCSVFILLSLVLSVGFAGNAYAEWNISTIATPAGTEYYDTKGKYSSIGIDSNNKAHISYMDQYGAGSGMYSWSLYYITNSAGSWVETSIASSYSAKDSGNFASLAVDKNNKVHISNMFDRYEYILVRMQYAYHLNHTSNASGSWASENVTSSFNPSISYNISNYTSIKTDSNNAVHIGYFVKEFSVAHLLYSTNSSGSWVSTVVDSATNVNVGSYVSIAVDSNNKAHMSYYDSINSALKYATNSSGSWVVSTIDNNGSVGTHTSIAVDSNNKVHISYYDSTNSAIKYATGSSGSWVTYTITKRGYSPSIAVDSSNHTHISFNYGSDLYYASNASGSWGISTVDSAGSVGEYSSIAVDSTGTVHISYYDSTNRSLKYAYGLPDTTINFLNVSKNGYGSGIITSSPAGIYCGSTCSTSFSTGTVVTLTATPESGSSFAGWSGDCSGTGTCTVTMDGEKSVGAMFTIVVNGGENWSAVNTGLANTDVRSLVIDPISPQTLYAGVSGGGIFKSVNGGGSWSPVNNGLTSTSIITLAIDPSISQTVFAGEASGGVFKSVNGGGSWSAVNTGLTNTNINFLVIDPSFTQTLYAGTYGGVFKSIDGGGGWSPVNTGLTSTSVTSFAIDPITRQTVYAGTFGGVFKSINGGESWSAVNTGLTSSIVTFLSIDPITPQTVYAGTWGGGVFKSVNGGENWSAVNSGLSNTNVNSFAINRSTPQTVYAGTSGGVFKSVDGGRSWVNTGLTGASIRSLAIDPSASQTIFAGTYGGGVFTATFTLRLGDINQDKIIDLADAILALQIVSGISPAVQFSVQNEVNNDGRIGIEEAIYVLQKISNIRQ